MKNLKLSTWLIIQTILITGFLFTVSQQWGIGTGLITAGIFYVAILAMTVIAYAAVETADEAVLLFTLRLARTPITIFASSTSILLGVPKLVPLSAVLHTASITSLSAWPRIRGPQDMQ